MDHGRYRHDVFVSYSRVEEWPDWVENKFVRVLRHWLTAELGRTAEIFLDVRSIGPGDDWPEALERGLAESRAMIALWTRNYWASDWCRREHSAMMTRAEELRSRHGVAVPLVFPMRLHDSEPDLLPAAVRHLQMTDIRRFAEPFASSDSRLLEGLSGLLRTFCSRYAAAIAAIPGESFTWPLADYSARLATLEGDAAPGGQTSLPGLG
jgi:hypothetical protein